MALRLGLDMGTNSIGWCLTEYDDARKSGFRVVDIGVRIFSDGRDPPKNGGVGAPLAEKRRIARGMRRRRDRFIRRRDTFLETLVEHGLMPADADEAKLLADLDPYKLRAEALDRQLEPYEIGRALFHLNQRRGFKSNRKAERKQNDPDKGKIGPAGEALDREMTKTGAKTLGQFLYERVRRTDDKGKPDPLPARVRMDSDAQAYDFYPQRHHYEHEFERIWGSQAEYHPALMTSSARTWNDLKKWARGKESAAPAEARDALYRAMFFQRPLAEQKVGLCSYAGLGNVGAKEERLPKWHPLFQQRRLYEEVNHLKIVSPGYPDRDLTLDERDKLIRVLKVTKEPTFATLAKQLRLQTGERFNKNTETRTTLLGDVIYAALAHKKLFGNAWPNMPLDRQLEVLDRLLNEESPEKLHEYLRGEHNLTEVQITQAEIASRALPEGYGRLGLTATQAVIAELERYLDEDGHVITYDKAIKRGLQQHHSDRRDGVDYSKGLPYYGEILSNQIAPAPLAHDEQEKRFGKITNPTVHIGLRQLEKLVNAIIKVHGRPDEIVVELARELKLNEKDKDKENQRIRQDTAAAKARSRKLSGEDAEGNQVGERIADDTGANRMLLRMWEELNPHNALDRRCPYCAEPIGVRQLFNGEAQVDHIIPYSKSLDDSAGNKVVAHRKCNQQKGADTPYEKWGHDPDRWSTITAQVARMHKNKQWRFGPDAMTRVQKDGGFIARQLTDTQYLSRLTGRYLTALYPEAGEGSRHVFMSTGRMTAMLRRLWALNDVLGDSGFVDNKNSNAPKNRLDHRHHAIDAFVMAVSSQALIAKVAEASGRAREKDLDRQFEGLPEPWPGYLSELKTRLLGITVSHKPDHGRKGKPTPGRDVTASRLHNDTAYGFVKDRTREDGIARSPQGLPIVVHRVPFSKLKPEYFTNSDRIADPVLRDALYEATKDRTGKDYDKALAQFSSSHPHYKGVRHVRVQEALKVIPILDKTGHAYKAFAGSSNARFNVWKMPDGSWKHDVVSTFSAHGRGHEDARPHPAAKKILSLRQSDLIAVERDGGTREIMRVIKFDQNGQVALVPHNEGGNLAERHKNATDSLCVINPRASGLKKMKARQVRIDPLGRVFDPGPR